MVNEFEIKKQICDIGRRIYNRNMVAANDGNISVKLNDNEFPLHPHRCVQRIHDTEYICKVNAKGEVIQANPGFKPSSEIKMHMRVYEKRPDVGSVVHAHPIYATSFAIAGIPLTQPIMPRQLLLWDAYPSLSTAHLPQWRSRTTLRNTFRISTQFFWRTTVLLPGPQT